MSEASSPAAEATKVCPDCSAQVRDSATICRECGYVFPTGPTPSVHPPGLTRDLAAAAERRTPSQDWLPIIGPLVAILLVLGLVIGTLLYNRDAGTWDHALRQLPRANAYDPSFAMWLHGWLLRDSSSQSAGAELSGSVVVAGGTCLVNLGTAPRGVVARLGAKSTGLAVACLYAAYRHRHGDSPVATVMVFANGSEQAEARFDGRKHPDFLAQIERDFERSMQFSSPEAMLADIQARMTRELQQP
jgi:hypothetical protein